MKSSPSTDRVRLLIASPLERRWVERIAAARPDRVDVIHAPDLLPTPRYRNDHGGRPAELDEGRRRRWRDLLAKADILFDFDWEDPAHLPQRAPRLRWVQATSAGIGEFVRGYGLSDSSIRFTTAAGVHAQPLAEFVAMALLYFAKDVPALKEWQRRHHWERYCGRELAGSSALLIGLGGVGCRVAEMCASLGVHVIGHRRTAGGVVPASVRRLISSAEIDETLPLVDYVIIAAPHTAETDLLIDAHRLTLFPDTCVLINVGRGRIVDERALIQALRDGRVRGAALDVFEREPLPADSPLWDMPNVLISPHSASTVERENERIVGILIDNLHRFLDGQPLINEYDHDRQY